MQKKVRRCQRKFFINEKNGKSPVNMRNAGNVEKERSTDFLRRNGLNIGENECMMEEKADKYSC